METHLSQHPYHTQMMPTLEGSITAIYAKDHPNNQPKAFTLYQVEVYPRFPSSTEVLGPIRAAGQEGGGNADQSDTFELGTQVLVGFPDGDVNKGVVLSKLPSFDNTISPTESELPVSRIERRGAKLHVDKNGKALVTLSENKDLEIVDSSGASLLKISKSGSGYKVKLMDGSKSFALESCIGDL